LRFDPVTSPSQRERRVAEAKAHYAALLRRLAAGATDDLTAHERRILHSFGEGAKPADFIDAVGRIRFQLGQADRFHEGLIRAASWEAHIARVLEQHGVPKEIAALPHVESSFNPAAYSKVGAAGLWQFMPSTAKRFMRVDSLVDERLDPYSATEAAANLMLYNYRLLGSWPLAVTAYNHGPAGLRRAQEQLGTSDIAVIVKRYQGANFGFASRNSMSRSWRLSKWIATRRNISVRSRRCRIPRILRSNCPTTLPSTTWPRHSTSTWEP
jgi:membrane-bound lytic murein transglycosylase D